MEIKELRSNKMLDLLRRGLMLAYSYYLKNNEYPECHVLFEEEDSYNSVYRIELWNDGRVNKGIPHVVVWYGKIPSAGAIYNWEFYLKENLV